MDTSETVHAYAAARRFASATTERWLRLASGDQQALLTLAERLRLGENQFRDFLDWSEEIAVRDGCSIAAVWARDPLAQALTRDFGRNETISALKTVLRGLRFPQLAAAEARLAELVRQLGLPRGARLALPEHLEGDTVTIELTGRSAQSLRETADAIATALRRSELDDIFRGLEQTA